MHVVRGNRPRECGTKFYAGLALRCGAAPVRDRHMLGQSLLGACEDPGSASAQLHSALPRTAPAKLVCR
jgi:hypothetical protein